MIDQKHLLYLNGLDATTGRPLIDPIPCDELTRRVLNFFTPQLRREESETYSHERLAPFDEYELDDPARAGWGLLVHIDEADAMRELLAPLIAHRNGRVLLYRDEPVRQWKETYHADAINPDRFPYYILIAGSPAKVPYELEYSLATLQAVGRIDFEDPADYIRYAQGVVERETRQAAAPGKRIIFFAPRHPNDYPTGQTSQYLIPPLLEQLPQSVPGLTFSSIIGDDATKTNLLAALTPDSKGQTPALLFSAGHGATFSASDPNQRALQGSFICQDYQMPLTHRQRRGIVCGYDVAEGFCLPGGIHFIFACYGAGTRAHSDFIRYMPEGRGRQRLETAQGVQDFVAYLPKALLAHPRSRALAVVGHVDPAWVHAFRGTVTRERRIDPFGFTLARLLRGKPVGFALMSFKQKYTDISTDLLSLIERNQKTALLPDPAEFMDLWICRNDAQNYVIIGDPAVRLRFG